MAESEFLARGNERFVSLVTFRKTGERVATAVWIVRDGDALIVTTPETSGKVKRLRHDPRVEIRPCNRFGRVEDGSVPTAGVAEIMRDNNTGVRASKLFRDKYGLEFRMFMAIERVMKSGSRQRVILSIVPGI